MKVQLIILFLISTCFGFWVCDYAFPVVESTATPFPTGTVTPVPTPIVTSVNTKSATGALVEKAVILYASKSGKREWPCTKKKPCDVATGLVKVCEKVFARTVIFNSLTDVEILQVMRNPCQ